MGRDSKIEWTTHTFNPWIGCTKVSSGCAHCYAEARMDHRFGQVKWGPGQDRKRTSAANWKLPVRWNKEAEGAAERPRVFCASLADVFDSEGPADARADLFALIGATPNLDWLLLTKRPQNILAMVPETWRVAWPAHAWIGTTVEDQKRADERIPHLLTVPARVRFLSCEPLLGPVQLGIRVGDGFSFFDYGLGAGFGHVDWVIAGGESGPGARPMHPDWARSLRDQCAKARVPFLFKQWGEWAEYDADFREPDGSHRLVQIGPRGSAPPSSWQPGVSALISDRGHFVKHHDHMRDGIAYRHIVRVGKAAAGRTLDGVLHDGYPAPA